VVVETLPKLYVSLILLANRFSTYHHETHKRNLTYIHVVLNVLDFL